MVNVIRLFFQNHNISTRDMDVFNNYSNVTPNNNLSYVPTISSLSPIVSTISSLNPTSDIDPSSPPSEMCTDLKDFSLEYKKLHGYICLVIIIFGAIANLLNIIVLTRKEMNGSPINRILSGEY